MDSTEPRAKELRVGLSSKDGQCEAVRHACVGGGDGDGIPRAGCLVTLTRSVNSEFSQEMLPPSKRGVDLTSASGFHLNECECGKF